MTHDSSHKLGELLLSLPDKPVTCSVDMGGSEHVENRCFGEFTGEINDVYAEKYTLIFENGQLNYNQ